MQVIFVPESMEARDGKFGVFLTSLTTRGVHSCKRYGSVKLNTEQLRT